MDDELRVYKQENGYTIKQMNKSLREEINVRECEQRNKLMDKIQKVFYDSNERIDEETNTILKRLCKIDRMVLEH